MPINGIEKNIKFGTVIVKQHYMKNVIICLSVLFFMSSGKPALTENQKIDKMISYVRTMVGVTFIRNGTSYTAKEAADHLQTKREKAGDEIKTARQFIKDIASVSSMSGQPYQMKFADGTVMKSGDVLTIYLNKLEKGQY